VQAALAAALKRAEVAENRVFDAEYDVKETKERSKELRARAVAAEKRAAEAEAALVMPGTAAAEASASTSQPAPSAGEAGDVQAALAAALKRAEVAENRVFDAEYDVKDTKERSREQKAKYKAKAEKAADECQAGHCQCPGAQSLHSSLFGLA
jgi:hypothetical protein